MRDSLSVNTSRSTPSLSRGNRLAFINESSLSVNTLNNLLSGTFSCKTKERRSTLSLSKGTSYVNGKGSDMAKREGPFVLVYESVPFAGKSEARMRESQIKGWSRIKKEKLISGEWK